MRFSDGPAVLGLSVVKYQADRKAGQYCGSPHTYHDRPISLEESVNQETDLNYDEEEEHRGGDSVDVVRRKNLPDLWYEGKRIE